MSWRDLNQGPRTLRSPQARQRKLRSLLRLGLFSATCALLLGGGVYSFLYAGQMLRKVEIPKPATPLVEVRFETNGFLKQEWFDQVMGRSLPDDLLMVDIYELKQRLEAHGQIAKATVRRELPGTLQISVEERQPVTRLRTRDAQGREIHLFVARDGIVFQGEQFPPEVVSQIPFLAGVRLRKADRGDGFAPIPQMPAVARLVELTRTHMGGHFRSWLFIDCSRFDGDPDQPGAHIKVRTSHFGDLIFAPNGFERQLERLARILNVSYRKGFHQIATIDLAFERQAVVSLR